MARNAIVVEVLIASPSDVQEEREAVVSVIQNWNARNSDQTGIYLQPVRWEVDSTPMLGTRGQELINQQCVRNSDILIGIFWTRLGTPTGEAESGTVEEIREFLSQGKPAMLYFSDRAGRPSDFDPVQVERLRQFKAEIQQNGLVFDFEDLASFREAVHGHLTTMAEKFRENVRTQPSPDDALALAKRDHDLRVARKILDIFDSRRITRFLENFAAGSISPAEYDAAADFYETREHEFFYDKSIDIVFEAFADSLRNLSEFMGAEFSSEGDRIRIHKYADVFEGHKRYDENLRIAQQHVDNVLVAFRVLEEEFKRRFPELF